MNIKGMHHWNWSKVWKANGSSATEKPAKRCTNVQVNLFSEALILATTNPQYDKRLFTDLPVQYMKTTKSEHVVYINCFLMSKQK